MAVPRRMSVAPSLMAASKSSLMPIECGQVNLVLRSDLIAEPSQLRKERPGFFGRIHNRSNGHKALPLHPRER